MFRFIRHMLSSATGLENGANDDRKGSRCCTSALGVRSIHGLNTALGIVSAEAASQLQGRDQGPLGQS